MRALDSIRKGTILLRNEIIRLTMGGWTLDLSDKVFGICVQSMQRLDTGDGGQAA